MSKNILLITFGTLSLAGLIMLLFHGPICQDQAYHHFADGNMIFSISNFWNVISNAPFILLGVIGLKKAHSEKLSGVKVWGVRSLITGIILVAFGSGYYHLNPSDDTLMWDRIPMTIIFMSLVALLIYKHISTEKLVRNLITLLSLGIGSVLWWAYGPGNDLRAYAMVQFAPMLFILLCVFSSVVDMESKKILSLMIGAYILAKFCEYFDDQLLALLPWSGHTFKHLFAVLASWYMVEYSLSKGNSKIIQH